MKCPMCDSEKCCGLACPALSVSESLNEIIERARSKTPCASNYQCLLADLLSYRVAPASQRLSEEQVKQCHSESASCFFPHQKEFAVDLAQRLNAALGAGEGQGREHVGTPQSNTGWCDGKDCWCGYPLGTESQWNPPAATPAPVKAAESEAPCNCAWHGHNRKIKVCAMCETPIEHATGIGYYCPNRDCKNVDGPFKEVVVPSTTSIRTAIQIAGRVDSRAGEGECDHFNECNDCRKVLNEAIKSVAAAPAEAEKGRAGGKYGYDESHQRAYEQGIHDEFMAGQAATLREGGK